MFFLFLEAPVEPGSVASLLRRGKMGCFCQVWGKKTDEQTRRSRTWEGSPLNVSEPFGPVLGIVTVARSHLHHQPGCEDGGKRWSGGESGASALSRPNSRAWRALGAAEA